MPQSRSPSVILVRPTEAGNIGAAARAMANTGLEQMIVVEPAARVDRTARAYAVHANEILDRAQRKTSFDEAVAPFSILVGTSSQRSRDPRVPVLTPRELATRLAQTPDQGAALVFGPERSGLTTDELARCSLLVRIPASERQPTLNLAQAVLIVGYELFVARSTAGSTESSGERVRERARIEEVEGFLGHARRVLGRIGFDRDDTFAAVFRDLRRLTARAGLSPREVQILRGILRRTEHRLARSDDGMPDAE